jgi:hypothetical protein
MLTLLKNGKEEGGTVSLGSMSCMLGSEAGCAPMPTSSALTKMHVSMVSGYSLVLASIALGDTEEGIYENSFRNCLTTAKK